MKVRALKNFDFVSSLDQRQKIRKGVKVPHDKRTIKDVVIGEVFELPIDMSDLVDRGVVEKVVGGVSDGS